MKKKYRKKKNYMLGTQCDNHVGPPVRMFREATVFASLRSRVEKGMPVKHQHPTPGENKDDWTGRTREASKSDNIGGGRRRRGMEP